MSFPRYPAYKESGVEWLGEVPEHWGLTALKHGYEVTLGKMLQPEASSEDDILLPYLRAANIHWSGVDHSDIKTMWFSIRDREHLLLQVGDLLVSEGGDVGRSAIWQGEISECYFQNSVNRVRPSNGNLTSFLCYWISTMKDKGFIDVLCNKSTIAHFTAEKVGAVPVPIPPVDEQQAIAHFLSQEIAKIDALIAEQQRLIELLQEKRQAVISHAVTKGLNPDAPMKDSGVEWLGAVPEHWEIKQLNKLINKITNGYVGPTRDILVDDGVRYLQSLHIKNNRIVFDTPYYVSREWSLSKEKSILRVGDVLIVQTGDIGQSAVVTQEFEDCNCHALIVVSSRQDLLSGDWLSWILNSTFGRESLLSIQTGALHPHLNCGNVKYIHIPVPPKDEQAAICDHVKVKNQVFDQLIFAASSSIDLMKERRSALISAAVTGQIDVRGLVPEVSAA